VFRDRISIAPLFASGAPTSDPRISRRLWPFALVAVFAQVSATIAPGVASGPAFAASCFVLALVVGAAVALPWQRLPYWAELLPALGYLASVGLLLAAAPPNAIGLAPLVLLPIAWVALYGRPWESAVVVLAAAITLASDSGAADEAAIANVRRAALWLVIGTLVSVASHRMRRGLGTVIDEREEARRQAEILAVAARELNASLDADEVISAALRLVAEVASTPGNRRRANYFRIRGERATLVAQFDETGLRPSSTTWLLSEHPLLAQAARTGRPSSGALDPAQLGAGVRMAVQEVGVTHAAYVPVIVDGRLHGVLAVASRDDPISGRRRAICMAIANVLELALTNALRHQRAERAAMTDPLTRLANRRGMELLVAERRGRRSFGVLSIDLDGLKATNDREGHAAGDRLLVAVAEAIATVVREGDVLARIGGDEFAAFVFDADEAAASEVAQRMLAAAHEAPGTSVPPRVSIGVAVGSATDSAAQILRRADDAMYLAKRQGGMRTALDVRRRFEHVA
jgi:diguanylate cyclase (GGDEF)-like protein